MLLELILVGYTLSFMSSHYAHGDKVQILDIRQSDEQHDSRSPDQRSSIIRAFFEVQGLRIDLEMLEYVQYTYQVVDKMDESLKSKSDFVKFYRLTREINSMIHEHIAEKEPSADEAIMKALDLIVPRSESQPIFELAKRDLRQFYEEQPKLGKELLERVGSKLDNNELHTQDAMRFLEGTLHNWVALGRLTKFIEENGEANWKHSFVLFVYRFDITTLL